VRSKPHSFSKGGWPRKRGGLDARGASSTGVGRVTGRLGDRQLMRVGLGGLVLKLSDAARPNPQFDREANVPLLRLKKDGCLAALCRSSDTLIG
jgi:hypothetical protein